MDKLTKFGLGLKIESLFIEIIQNIFTASRKPRDSKLVYLARASDSLDILKFLLQILWEMNVIDNRKYISLSNPLDEVGRMLGGWLKQTKTP